MGLPLAQGPLALKPGCTAAEQAAGAALVIDVSADTPADSCQMTMSAYDCCAEGGMGSEAVPDTEPCSPGADVADVASSSSEAVMAADIGLHLAVAGCIKMGGAAGSDQQPGLGLGLGLSSSHSSEGDVDNDMRGQQHTAPSDAASIHSPGKEAPPACIPGPGGVVMQPAGALMSGSIAYFSQVGDDCC